MKKQDNVCLGHNILKWFSSYFYEKYWRGHTIDLSFTAGGVSSCGKIICIFSPLRSGLVMWLALANEIQAEVMCGASNTYRTIMICLVFFSLCYGISVVWERGCSVILGPRGSGCGEDSRPAGNGYIAQGRNKPLFSLRFWSCY